ncbi:penicillin acylase family protein [Nonomuraea sp. NPDC050556]|uniref:penicillin acylase family protein n=1 Tax=Nonomuraea sp. NPDC050556 TaxID=3364369 RepID=UPI0037A4C231
MRRTVRSGAGLAVALATSVVAMLVAVQGVGPVPALGSVTNPQTGVWATGRDAQLPRDATLQLPALDGPAEVGFEANGVAHIKAGTDADLFRTVGYLHARYRLFQMEVERRRGRGELAEVLGPDGVASDKFERDLGLLRSAEAEWAALPQDAPSRKVLVDYAAGVNAGIDELRGSGELSMMFKLLGVEPRPWTPVDSLVVQREMAQELSYHARALNYQLVAEALGKERAREWLPINGPALYYPFDRGPYKKLPLDPAPQRLDGVVAVPSSGAQGSGDTGQDGVRAIGDLFARMDTLPQTAMHTISNSNAWAVSGTRTASGKPLLASDPHLQTTLPAYWYQLSARSPGYRFSGAGIPGIPIILIGKNDRISWGLTNSQHTQTLFYLEKTDKARPDQYFYQGSWRPMQKIAEKIKVRGEADVDYNVRQTASGPVISEKDGRTVTVWWAGQVASNNLDAMLGAVKATDFATFRSSLRTWGAPAQNFVYADSAGNIGAVSAGIAAQVRSGDPNGMMPGSGGSEVIGTVPYDAMPTVYNPDSGVVITANQREVSDDYPYFFGSNYDFYDPGWRAAELTRQLKDARGLTAADTQRLQLDTHDTQARMVLPSLLKALEGQQLTADEKLVVERLRTWDLTMKADQLAPLAWERFANRLSYDVFQPWWTWSKMPKREALILAPYEGSQPGTVLRETLSHWILTDQDNPAFTSPGTPKRNAVDAMRQSFHTMVADLAKDFGKDASKWNYGLANQRMLPSLAGIEALDEPPVPTDGNGRTINVATGVLLRPGAAPGHGIVIGGSSWRFVMDWGTGQAVAALPGGQSENPVSPWYRNLYPGWRAGAYEPLHDGAGTYTKGRTWTLQP